MASAMPARQMSNATASVGSHGRNVRSALQSIQTRLAAQIDRGFDINLLAMLARDVRQLRAYAAAHDASVDDESLASLADQLDALVWAQRLPDAAMAAMLADRAQSAGSDPGPPPGDDGLPSLLDLGHSDPRQVAPAGWSTRCEIEPSDLKLPAELAEVDNIVPTLLDDQGETISPAGTGAVKAMPSLPMRSGQTASSFEAESQREGLPEQAQAPAPAARSNALPVRSAASFLGSKAEPGAEGPSHRGARVAPITRIAAVAKPAATRHRVYHLTAANELAIALDQRMEANGFELELLDDAEELIEIIGALAPDAILVDPEFLGDLEAIGEAVAKTRRSTGTKLPLVAVAAEDSLRTRLIGRRAGVSVLVTAPHDDLEVLQALQQTLAASEERKFRILIVEDDRTQAMFAESILRNAGMEARSVDDAFAVIDTMTDFDPDLVLMDLYMPECDGAELTGLIRERDEFLDIPIVFLSGESDEDRHFEAISAGGDDFLAKPIRPKHLIAAVSNRVRRARQLRARNLPDTTVGADASGLYPRAHVWTQIAAQLDLARDSTDPDVVEGGVLLLEIDSVGALRERLGLSPSAELLASFGQALVSHLREDSLACREGDGLFAVSMPIGREAELDEIAALLRSRLTAKTFEAGGQALNLRFSIGVAPYSCQFVDASTLLDAAERVAREARARPDGVKTYRSRRSVDAAEDRRVLELLDDALAAEQLPLEYQPIVAVQGGDQAQYQVLMRLREADGGFLTAGSIIPAAERAGRVGELDRHVVHQSLADLARHSAQGQNLRLFVTQSPQTLMEAGYTEWLAQELGGIGLDPDWLVIDVVMGDFDADRDAVVRVSSKISALGVRLCLSRVHGSPAARDVMEAMELSFIRLAPKFLAASEKPQLRDELKGVVEAAHLRSIEVIAPRVEDAQSAATLWISGIDYLQGNLVQRAGSSLNFDFQNAVL